MKSFSIILFIVLLFISAAHAQTNGHSSELDTLIQRVDAKITVNKHTEADYSDEIKAFDTFTAKEKESDPTNAAAAAYMKAQLYAEILGNYDKTRTTLQELTNDFPRTPYGQRAAKLIPTLDQQANQENAVEEARKKQEELLKPGTPFPDFSEKDLDGKPISVGALKGKVVLVDFWATWCPPCRMALPDIIATYKKHHEEGLEIIGVSLDDDRSALDKFLKETDGMTWPEYFDGKQFDNKLAIKYLVLAIPSDVLVGADGKIIGVNLLGPELETAIDAALVKSK